ncbi:MAG: hypothetical protein ABIQ97_04310 [Lysobacteraceae bacterium]
MIGRVLFVLCWLGAEGNTIATELEHSRLTMKGLGPLRIGMTEKDVRRLNLSFREQFPPAGDPDSLACNIVMVGKDPGVRVMFENHVLTRIESGKNRHMKTMSGVQIGMTERNVKRIVGPRLRVEHHFYTDGHYLKLFSKDGFYAIVFETDGNRVTNMLSGRKESAQYVEGCE